MCLARGKIYQTDTSHNISNVLFTRFQPNFILMIMDFEEWKVRRKMYNPGFKRRYIYRIIIVIKVYICF